MGNRICHMEIPCKDIGRAKAFYTKIFEWSFEDAGEEYAMFNTGSGIGGALDLRTEPLPAQRGVTLYIEVQDIAQCLAKVREAGGAIIKEKTEIGKDWGYYALFSDSEGNAMGLWSKS